MQAQTPEVSAEKATTPPAIEDRTIYECTGCGTVTRDRAAQMALYKRAGALSCCPERNLVPVQQGELLNVTHRPLIRNAINLLGIRRPVAPDVERVIADLEAMLDGQPTSAGAPSGAWLHVAEQAAPVEPAPAQDELLPCPFCGRPAATAGKKATRFPWFKKVACSNDGCGAHFAYWHPDEWNRRATRPAQTEQQLEQRVVKDAERYRWLRDKTSMPGVVSSNSKVERYFNEYMLCGEQMDKAIDAAMDARR